jgi:hypothetical protein
MKGTYMTTLNLKFFAPSADGYTEKSMSFEPQVNSERNMSRDDELATILSNRTMSLNEKYDSIREHIANIGKPVLDNENRFTI